MAFDKPKVTIDLEEYNSLIAVKDGFNVDEYVIAAKKVVAAMLNRRGDPETVAADLKKDGIAFSITTPMSAEFIRPEHINIFKVK